MSILLLGLIIVIDYYKFSTTCYLIHNNNSQSKQSTIDENNTVINKEFTIFSPNQTPFPHSRPFSPSLHISQPLSSVDNNQTLQRYLPLIIQESKNSIKSKNPLNANLPPQSSKDPLTFIPGSKSSIRIRVPVIE